MKITPIRRSYFQRLTANLRPSLLRPRPTQVPPLFHPKKRETGASWGPRLRGYFCKNIKRRFSTTFSKAEFSNRLCSRSLSWLESRNRPNLLITLVAISDLVQ